MLPDPLDFDRICRMCLSSSEKLIDLFNSKENFVSLLQSITALSFTANDDLPQHICPFCSHQIQTTRYFIVKCQESDRKLRLSLQNPLTKTDENVFRDDEQQVLNNVNSDNVKSQTQSHAQNKNSRDKRSGKSSSLNRAKKHIENEESDKVSRSHKCVHCRHEYPCNETLLDHMKIHNQEESVGSTSHAENSLAPTNNSAKSKYLCEICNKTFARPINLERHKVKHEKSERETDFFQCTVCGKQMKHINHFKIHMRSHRNCSTNSPTTIDTTSGNKKQYLCSTCGKACTSRSNLAVHTRRHTGIMTNFCNICGKGYPRSTDLTIHMRKHTGEKPFCCTICHRSFARSDKLTIHVRTHTGEKPYECSNCNRSFAQRNDLISHQRRNVCGSAENKTEID